MPITSDITIDVSKFRRENVGDETKQINAMLAAGTNSTPRWEDVGIEKWRALYDAGETYLPKPVYLPGALDQSVPSREAGRDIPIRVYKPENGQPSKGVIIHFHGGGFIFGSHKYYDGFLKAHTDLAQLTAISVGYRLAPEHPSPASVDDSIDAVEYIADHAERDFGAPLRFLCGESAGGTLSVQCALHLMRARPSHPLAGLILPFGAYDVSVGLPAAATFTQPLMINAEILNGYFEAYLPGRSIAERRDPRVSPLYEDLPALVADAATGPLPPALFLCGTEDPLLDDSIMMGIKWQAAGGEGIIKIYPGAAHGFTGVPGLPVGEEANAVYFQFLMEKLAAASLGG